MRKFLGKLKQKVALLINIRNRLLKFLGQIPRKEGLEMLTVTKHIEGKDAQEIS